MQRGDLVAIIRTGAGMGALQQFTADKRQLYSAIERVKWNPMGRGGISALAPAPDRLRRREGERGRGEKRTERGGRGERSSAKRIDQLREDIFAVGTLGALNFVVRGLRDLPVANQSYCFPTASGSFAGTVWAKATSAYLNVASPSDLANAPRSSSTL